MLHIKLHINDGMYWNVINVDILLHNHQWLEYIIKLAINNKIKAQIIFF